MKNVPALVKMATGTLRGDCYIKDDLIFGPDARPIFPRCVEWVDSIEMGRKNLDCSTYSLLLESIIDPLVNLAIQHERSISAARRGH